MRNLIILISLLVNYQIYSQLKDSKKLKIDYEYNISVEGSILYSTKKFTKIQKNENFSDFYPIGFYISGLMFIEKNIAFEFKPGIVIGGEYYSGFEYSFNMRYYLFDKKYYTGIGINIHDNFGAAHGTAVSTWATDEAVTYLGLKIAYKPKSFFSFTLSYFLPLEKYDYYSISDYFGDSYIVEVNHIAKLGFEFSL